MALNQPSPPIPNSCPVSCRSTSSAIAARTGSLMNRVNSMITGTCSVSPASRMERSALRVTSADCRWVP